jgi:hypothetical protein
MIFLDYLITMRTYVYKFQSCFHWDSKYNVDCVWIDPNAINETFTFTYTLRKRIDIYILAFTLLHDTIRYVYFTYLPQNWRCVQIGD